jgi:hypothetical protein
MATTHNLNTIESLGHDLLHHFMTEQDVLRRVLEHIERVRSALLERDADGLQAATSEMQVLQSAQNAAVESRRRLQQTAADLLRLNFDQVTTTRIARRLPTELATEVLREQKQLRGLAQKANRLNRANMMFMSSAARLTRHVLESLTGKPLLQCYGRSGQLDDQTALSLFQAEL